MTKPLGKHMILDIWGPVASFPFWNMDAAAEMFVSAAKAAGATVLTERWHHFGDGHGYTGVVVLAESHISVHTWPEKGYAAVDVFMCGDCDPVSTMDAITAFYKSEKHVDYVIERGTSIEATKSFNTQL